MRVLSILIFFYSSQLNAQFFKNQELEEWQENYKNKSSKDILDYYFLLPNSVFDCETNQSVGKVERTDFIKIKNVRNGYISFESVFNISIALFKNRSENRDIIAISINESGRGSTCGGLNTFYEFYDGRWHERLDLQPNHQSIYDMIKSYYSDPSDAEFYYNLPQIGTTIEITDDFTGEIIGKLKWNGTNFELTY